MLADDLCATYAHIASYLKSIQFIKVDSSEVLMEFPAFAKVSNILGIVECSLDRLFKFLRVEFGKKKTY